MGVGGQMTLMALLASASFATAADKVNVSFYGESLCPFCAGLTTSVLNDIFQNGISTLTNFRYIGWGNVRQDGDCYVCQHGPLECIMNTVLNCGQELSSNQDQFFQFLYCIESQAGPEVKASIPGCAKAASIGLKPLEECFKGDKGKQLDDAARNDTNSLTPAHTYVPWVTVNGIPIYGQVDYLASYICVAYPGTRPQACLKSLSRELPSSK